MGKSDFPYPYHYSTLGPHLLSLLSLWSQSTRKPITTLESNEEGRTINQSMNIYKLTFGRGVFYLGPLSSWISWQPRNSQSPLKTQSKTPHFLITDGDHRFLNS